MIQHRHAVRELGATSQMIPVDVKVRSMGDSNSVLRQKDLHFNVFVNQKWTPYLMMVTLFNSMEGLNDYADEATYRLSGQVELDADDREVLMLRHFEELSNAEAAQVLGIRPSAAVNRYVRALKRLKDVFQGMPGGIEGV